MTLPRHLSLIIGAVALTGLALVYAFFDPSAHLFPRCIFLTLTGYQCPGCGSQRALHALLTGNLAQAWHFNPLLVAAIPFLILLFVASWHKHRFPVLYNRLNSIPAIAVWAIAVIGWAVFRNL